MVRACVLMVAVLGAMAGAQEAPEPVEREVVPASENAANLLAVDAGRLVASARVG